MSNSENADFYFGISDNKIYICFLDNKKMNQKIVLVLIYLIV